MTEEVSIRMNDDDDIAPPAFIFAPRPDKKGPKTIAILLIMGSLIMILVGWGDIQNSMRDDFPEEGNDIISNFENNDEVNVTIDDYQEFHDEIRDNGYYTIRGYSLTIGGGLLIVGGVNRRISCVSLCGFKSLSLAEIRNPCVKEANFTQRSWRLSITYS